MPGINKCETICIYPFKTAEIFSDGNVYGCSGGRALSYSFGNIFEKPFDEIWNGERALEFRRQFIEKDYKYCNFEKCTQKKCAEFSASEKKLPYPARVQLHINDAMPDDIEKYIMPVLQNAKLINLNTQGEFFEDEKAEKLIQKIIKNYPDIKYAVCTKGAYDIEKGLKKYRLIDKTAHIIINPSAADDKLIKNVKYAAGLKQEGKINDCALQLEKDILNNEIKEKIEASGIKIQYKKEIKTVCSRPFTSADINASGFVYTCCSDYIRQNNIGRIWENNLEEIWNGGKAQEIRRKILNGDYSMCDLNMCMQRFDIDSSILPENCSPPERITLSYNRECNLMCITCRDKKHINTEEENKLYNEQIYNKISMLLKDVQIIEISGSGEALYSRHSRELIKRIASEYKHIKWTIYTNGVFFNSMNCRNLGIYGRIHEVFISVHALNKELYNKIMRGSDYDAAMKNIKEAAYEYNNNKTIKRVILNAVISNLNYAEIPALAKFALKHNVYLALPQYRYWGTEFGKDYKTAAVWEKGHPEYEKFKKVLKHPNLDYQRIYMPPLFDKIRKED